MFCQEKRVKLEEQEEEEEEEEEEEINWVGENRSKERDRKSELVLRST